MLVLLKKNLPRELNSSHSFKETIKILVKIYFELININLFPNYFFIRHNSIFMTFKFSYII